MEIGINKKEHKHKGQLGGRADNSSNLKRINLALQGGGSHGAFRLVSARSSPRGRLYRLRWYQRHECRRGERRDASDERGEYVESRLGPG
jgi:hypothetical protein